MQGHRAGAWHAAAFAALVIAVAIGGAPAARASADYAYVNYRDSYVVQADGSFIETVEMSQRPLTRSAVEDMATVDLSFSESLATLEIIDAYVEKADGTRIDVPKDAIKLQNDAASDGAPMFTDEKHKVIVFPNVDPGDQIVYKARTEQKTAYFPGHFLQSWTFPEYVEVTKAQIDVSVPEGMMLYVDTKGFERTAGQHEAGRVYYEWRYQNDRPIDVNTTYAVSFFDDAARLEISTMPDYKTLAKAYEARAADKAVPNDEIRKLAEDLTKGITDRREQARALYDWVNLNIRYVATYVGAGGYVPHAAADVLRNRYGDCKDHVAMLEALLAAKGIDSSAVIVNSGSSFRLPKYPTLHPFDHAITYLPEFDLYVDSTHALLPFGVLGSRLNGKPAIVTKLDDPVRSTPAFRAEDNGVTVESDLSVGVNGGLYGISTATFRGSFSSWIRSTLVDTGSHQMGEWATAWLNDIGLQGTSTLEADEPYNLQQAFKISGNLATEGFLDMEDASAFHVPESYLATYTFSALANDTLEASRDLKVTCNAMSMVDIVKIELPERIDIIGLPRGTHAKSGALEYEATYTLDGRNLTVVRRYMDRSPKGYCTQQEMADQVAIANAIKRDLRKLILYRPTPNL